MQTVEITSPKLWGASYHSFSTFSGSSVQTENEIQEDLETSLARIIMEKSICFITLLNRVDNFIVDSSTKQPNVEAEITTYNSEYIDLGEILDEDIEYDLNVRIKSINEYTAHVKVISREKAVPKFVDPNL